MKQIFDWLREKIKGLRNAEADYYYAYSNDVIDREDTLDLVNEAEAKWESDCCEWHRIESSEFDYMDSKHGFFEEYTPGWNFCPYCGKPIKISEVE